MPSTERLPSVGILGIGVYVPPVIRPNAAWQDEVVSIWRAHHGQFAPTQDLNQSAPGVQLASRLVQASLEDPFAGIAQRYVTPADVSTSDVETAAATDALRTSGITAGELGLIVCASAVPDQLISDDACRLHHRLGAPPECVAIWVDAACNAFLLALSLAVPMLQSGAVRYALLVQSSTLSRILDYTRPGSQYFGDCATAAVIGHVASGRGLITPVVSHTDGSLNAAVAVGRRGRPWHAGDRALLHAPDPETGRQFALSTLDKMKAVADAVFAVSGYSPADVDFVGTHQAFPWMRAGIKEHIGFTAARDFDAFTNFGNCAGATLPLVLAMGARAGSLHDGDLVFLGGLGAGATASAALIRWGKGEAD